jgi:hypothetical protein
MKRSSFSIAHELKRTKGQTMIYKPLYREQTISHYKCDCDSDCCLTPIQQFFSYIMARTSYISMR